MQANPRNLDALFNSQLRYVVPMFQRLYVWQEKPQWETLWEDVAEKAELQLLKKRANAHYLGALIIEGVRPESPREVKRFLIIDGQQRLTTLQLLLCAFRDYSRNSDWKTLDRTASRYLENADIDVMEKPDEERFKLWPTTLNRKFFSDIILAGSRDAIEIKHPLVRLKWRRKPEPRNSLVEAYLYFYAKIAEWTTATANAKGVAAEISAFSLLQALQQDFAVVEIALSEGDDSQEIFYSLNSQGRPLSQSDLLRSLIFMRAEKEKVSKDEIFDKYWGQFESVFWSAEIKRGGRSFSRLDLGLRYFLMAKTGKLVDTRRVNEDYRHWIASTPTPYSSVQEELADFSRYSKAYQRYEAVETGTPSTDIRRVLQDLDVSTALPLLLFLEVDGGLQPQQCTEVFDILESFLVRRAICGAETKEYNKLFSEMVGELINLEPEQVKARILSKLLTSSGITRAWPTDAEVIETAVSQPLFQILKPQALRLVLERIELKLRGKKSEDRTIPEGLQIEHVMPQSWATHWPLNGKTIPALVALYPFQAVNELAPFADAIRARNKIIHTLGNLTLCNKYLNPAASNGSFDFKRVEYAHSVLRCNRYFDQLTNWNEEAVIDRGKVLGQLICQIWTRPT